MSFFRIRCLKSFGDFHKVFESKPIFPDEQVEVATPFHTYQKIDKLRRNRLWLLMSKEKLDAKIKKKLKMPNDQDYMTGQVVKNKDEKYFEERGLLGKDEDISEFFDLDRETFLPYGFGYDSIIKDLKERNVAEASQDKIRDIWIKLGFVSTSHVISSASQVDMKDSIEKIKRRIYTSRHKVDPIAYKNIENDEDPRSQQFSNDKAEFFSEDYSDKEPESIQKQSLKLVQEKYKEKALMSDFEISDEVEDYNREQMEGFIQKSEEEIENPESGDDHHRVELPKVPKNYLFPNWWHEHETLSLKLKQRKKNIYNATKLVESKFKKRAFPIFFKSTPKGYFQSVDYEYDMKLNKGLVPTFAELIVEAEKLILSNPKLQKLNERDEYERNKHFVPRYLDKTLTPENYFWSFVPKHEVSQFPGYITGLLPFREDPDNLVEMTDLSNKIANKGYHPNPKDFSVKVYSLVKNDPYHMHYLNNHIKFWNESLRENLENNGSRDVKSRPMIPWEYIHATPPKVFKRPDSGQQVLDEEGYSKGYGKRKDAKARAYVRPGTGIITVNGKNLIQYSPNVVVRDRIVLPFRATGLVATFDAKILAYGGGIMGQAHAIQLAVARALTKYYPLSPKVLHEHCLLTVDPRRVERKKTNKYKARKSYTWVKR